MHLSFALLALTILSVWLPTPRGPLWPWVFAGSLACARGFEMLDNTGVLSATAPMLTMWAAGQVSSAPLRIALKTCAIVLGLALGLHLLPGFLQTLNAPAVQVSDGAPPLLLVLRYDNACGGLFFLAFFVRRAEGLEAWRALWRSALGAMAATTLAVIGTALLLGYVRIDPKLPAITGWFVAKMLFVTCVVEESFFRGFLQERLTRFCASRAPASAAGQVPLRWLPVVTSAGVFGLAHAAGGWLYVGLATLAGLGYAWAYDRTRSIEVPLLTHFTVNTVHFLGFTYPYLLHAAA